MIIDKFSEALPTVHVGKKPGLGNKHYHNQASLLFSKSAKAYHVKIIYLLICLFISTVGQSQNTYRSSKRNQRIEDSQNSDFKIYCDDEIEAHFPGGVKAWIKFVKNEFRMKVPLKNNAPHGTYKVIISFLIAKDGKISNVKADTNFGYGIEEELMRVINHGPKWIPATNCGKRINASKRQPVTIIVS